MKSGVPMNSSIVPPVKPPAASYTAANSASCSKVARPSAAKSSRRAKSVVTRQAGTSAAHRKGENKSAHYGDDLGQSASRHLPKNPRGRTVEQADQMSVEAVHPCEDKPREGSDNDDYRGECQHRARLPRDEQG